MRDDEIPAEIQERLETIGTAIRCLLKDEDDPSVVCAVLSANLDTWSREHGHNASRLASAVAMAVMAHARD